jgi:hypothetical protein
VGEDDQGRGDSDQLIHAAADASAKSGQYLLRDDFQLAVVVLFVLRQKGQVDVAHAGIDPILDAADAVFGRPGQAQRPGDILGAM